jgi:NAD(P)-dependent dehydrogenase (short-subunit alcohol dehydrogenase family)/acyl carrier protein
MAVELHEAAGDTPPTIKGELLATLLQVLREGDVAGFPEVLVENGVVYGNQITQMTSSAMQPRPRALKVVNAKDVEEDVILLSERNSDLSNLQAVCSQTTPAQSSEDRVRIRVNSFAQAPRAVSVPSRFWPRQASAAPHVAGHLSSALPSYVVMAMEVSGVSDDETGRDVTACWGVPVGSVVSVPRETVVDMSSLPEYRAGDLSKLVLLWSLAVEACGQDCTILATKDTEPLAVVVKSMCLADGKKAHNALKDDGDGSTSAEEAVSSPGPKTDIVMVEDLLVGDPKFSSCLLPLTYIDLDLMTFIAERWQNGSRLVAFSSLVAPDVESFMACNLSEVECHLMDGKAVLQNASLKESVPRVKAWIARTDTNMMEICQRLHDTEWDGVSCADSGNATGLKKSRSGMGGERNTSYDDRHELFEGRVSAACHSSVLPLVSLKEERLADLTVALREDELLSKRGVYAVVGGLTGLGWLCAQFLAQHGAGHVAIVNRRAPDAGQRARMSELAARCECRVQAFQADIASFRSLQHTLQEITQVWAAGAPLRGVLTGAAVLRDSPFLTMQPDDFHSALAPKVKGTWNLHVLTRHAPLDLFVTHSSVASVLGNQGQANYSTANAFMDGLAWRRVGQGLAAQAINWGPLDTGLLHQQEAVKRRLDAIGFGLDDQASIAARLGRLLALNLPQAVPVTLNNQRFAGRFADTPLADTRFKHLMSTVASPKHHSEEADKSKATSASKIRFLPASERLARYEEHVRDLVVRVLSVEARHVTRDVSLHALGLDSVSGIMLLSLLERHTGFRLSNVMLLASDVTIHVIARALNDAAAGSQATAQ